MSPYFSREIKLRNTIIQIPDNNGYQMLDGPIPATFMDGNGFDNAGVPNGMFM